MKRIPLTQGKFAIVDDCDFELLSALKWQAWQDRKNGVWYAIRTNARMHRVILGVVNSNIHVDHVNRDGLDNRRANLRRATRSQNLGNRRKNLNNTSGFKGVDFHRPRGTWRVRVQTNGKSRCIGYFHDIEVAAEAYRVAAKKHFGEFARFA